MLYKGIHIKIILDRVSADQGICLTLGHKNLNIFLEIKWPFISARLYINRVFTHKNTDVSAESVRALLDHYI